MPGARKLGSTMKNQNTDTKHLTTLRTYTKRYAEPAASPLTLHISPRIMHLKLQQYTKVQGKLQPRLVKIRLHADLSLDANYVYNSAYGRAVPYGHLCK